MTERSKTVLLTYTHQCMVTGQERRFTKYMGVNPRGFYEKPVYVCHACGHEAELERVEEK